MRTPVEGFGRSAKIVSVLVNSADCDGHSDFKSSFTAGYGPTITVHEGEAPGNFYINIGIRNLKIRKPQGPLLGLTIYKGSLLECQD